MVLRRNERYVQFAFNGSINQVNRVLPQIAYNKKIFIEAGTPYIKQYGLAGISLIRKYWQGIIVADLKVTDGAIGEIQLALGAGANAISAMGSAPVETLDFFNQYCAKQGIYSMIDMLGVINPMKKMQPLKHKPDFVVIHKGRDEESNARNIIRFKDIAKIRSKYESFISVAGGLDQTNVRRAFFNGADVAILNIISRGDPNNGLLDSEDFERLVSKILSEVGQ
ncbi:MAG: hypothetical protein JXA54_17305 [Candidatus Heimdallarchaeota archaeon]|nr:hypothetical protein [Candidatus Heimdallarchaeota archaeon]